MRLVDDKGNSPDFVPRNVDETFKQLIAEKRPRGEYYNTSMGDKLLYLKRIDKL